MKCCYFFLHLLIKFYAEDWLGLTKLCSQRLNSASLKYSYYADLENKYIYNGFLFVLPLFWHVRLVVDATQQELGNSVWKKDEV